MRSFLAENNLKEAVSEIVRPTNEQVQALYSRAAALLFPSWHEGFGLPIIEAQACCCPVFTSNRAPMTEVGGEAVVYIDPENPRDAASVIRDELPKLAHRIKAGQENVKRFSTDAMIEGYINTYQHVLKQR
jgi:glycosyltransferase involved in cell wall biosynthesis